MRSLSGLILCFFLVARAEAQTTAQPANRTVVPDAERESNALQLSLDDAVRTAAEKNLGVALQNYEYRMAGHSARSAYGLFDFQAFGTLQTQSQEQPVSSRIFSPESEQTLANFGVQQTIPTGGNYAVSFNNARQSSNNPFVTVDPAFTSNLGLDFTQPLLRNFGVDVTRRGVNIARNTLGITREAFRNALTQTVYQIEQAYYDLIYARELLEVQRQSLFLAHDQARITQIRIDVGASAPLDILQPRVAIATREEQVITAEALVRNAEDRLRQLMNLPPAEWDRPIVPTDPIGYRPMSIDMTAAVARAYELRPEIEQAQLGSRTREIQYHYARNQVLPRLDLKVDYGFAGLGGDQLILDENGQQIGVIAGGYSDALDQVYGFDFPSWTVGVDVGVPISNIGARAEAKRAQLDLARSKTDEERVRQSVAVEVRQAARDIDTASRQISATRAAREAAEKNLDAERKRYENGMTTNFNVLLIQQELADARTREIQAMVAHNKAIANYHRAVGDLLEVRNISLQVPENFSLPPSRYEGIDWLNSRQ